MIGIFIALAIALGFTAAGAPAQAASCPPQVQSVLCWTNATRPAASLYFVYGFNTDTGFFEYSNGTAFVTVDPGNMPKLHPVVACDGTTDNAPVLQAAINSLQANSPSGGIIQLPACNNIGIGSGLTITGSNILINGTGGGGPTGVGYINQPTASSVLVALPSLAGGDMVHFEPANNAPSIKRGGLTNLILECNGQAANGLVTLTQKYAQFEFLTIAHCTSIQMDVGTTANTLSDGTAKDHQHSRFYNILLDWRSNAAAATGIRLRGGPGTDVSLDHFQDIRMQENGVGGITGSIGLDCAQADSNIFANIAFGNSGANPVDVLLRASNANPTCRSHNFINFGLSGAAPNGSTIVAQGQETGSNLPQANYVWANMMAPGAFMPSVAPTGISGNIAEGNKAIYWITNFGDTNIAPPSAENLVINGSFMVNQRFGAGNVTPATTRFVTDRWKSVIAGGLGNKMSFIQNTAQHPLTATTTERFSTSTQTAPAASGDATSFCTNIEGVDVADLAWGTPAAKTLTLSFWANSFNVAGNYSVYLLNSAATRSYVISYNLPAATTWYYLTFQIPGDTVAPATNWLTGAGQTGISLCFDLGASANFQTTTTQAWQAGELHEHSGDIQQVNQPNSTLFFITKVRLKKGNGNGLYAQPGYQQELARAQRYLYALAEPAVGVISPFTGFSASATGCVGSVKFPVTMVAPPTLTATGTALSASTWKVQTPAATAALATPFAATSTANSVDGASINLTSSGLTAGQPCLLIGNGGGSILTWDADF